MSDRLLIDIGIAATRWHAIAQRRQLASSKKRRIAEACKEAASPMTGLWIQQSEAAAQLSQIKREEKKALKTLAALCKELDASSQTVEDITEVQEVRMLTNRSPEKSETPKQVELPEASIANHQASQA